MPRYHFDYHEPDGLFLDEVGHELTDPEHVRRLALRALGEATSELATEGRTGTVVIQVRDDSGVVLVTSATVHAHGASVRPTSKST